MLTQHKILITNTPYEQNILKALKNTSLALPIQHGYQTGSLVSLQSSTDSLWVFQGN